MCALREPLGDIGRIEMYALSFIIVIIFIVIVGIINIYYCYYHYLGLYIVPN